MKNINDGDLIKDGSTKEAFNLNKIREDFFQKYCLTRGWDISNLTPEQLNEIKSQKEYINPGIILS